MDQERRETLFKEAFIQFLDNHDDALWLFKAVKERVKDQYPGISLTRTLPAGGGDLTTRITNDNNRVDGNVWKHLRVIPRSQCSLTLSLGDR